jgi:hypothetical protein
VRFLLYTNTANLYSGKTVRLNFDLKLGSLLTLFTSGVIGFVRSYGKYLQDEKITINAICPNVVRTNISSSAFYEQLDAKGLLTPMESLIEVFESLLGTNKASGEIYEVGPRGIQDRPAVEYMDNETQDLCELLLERARPLQATAI